VAAWHRSRITRRDRQEGLARLGLGEHECDDAPAGPLGVETVRIPGCHAGQNRRGEHLGQGVGIYVRADLAGRYPPLTAWLIASRRGATISSK
jgi:hypothetical protein